MLPATSSHPLILRSEPSMSSLLLILSCNFLIWRKTAFPGWHWDSDLRTALPSSKHTHYTVLQVSFSCLWVYSIACFIVEKIVWIQDHPEIYLRSMWICKIPSVTIYSSVLLWPLLKCLYFFENKCTVITIFV